MSRIALSKIKYILLLTSIATNIAFAQISYEIDAHYGFGASELSFNSVPGLAFTVYPKKNFGISVGFDYSWRWSNKTKTVNDSNKVTTDYEGDNLILKYSIKELLDERSAQIFMFPIMFKYSNDNYYAAAGVKIGIVNSVEAKVNYKGLNTEGYYPDYNIVLTEPAFQGFGEQRDSSLTKNIKSETLFLLALEGGLRFKLYDDLYFLIGVFAEYSLNKGFERDLSKVVERIEHGDLGADIAVYDAWEKWNPWSVGAVIKVAYHFGKTEENKKEEDARKAEELAQKLKAVEDAQRELAKRDSLLALQKAEADRKLDALGSQTVNVFRDARGTILSMSDILFETGHTNLKPELKENLAEIAAILKTLLKESKITIEGHTDNTGSAEVNMALSKQRAEAVLEYLAQRGVERSRMEAVGYGLTKPIADNSTEEGRAKNRRVELIIK